MTLNASASAIAIPVSVPEDMAATPDQLPVKTTCAYCGVGCGVLATPLPDTGDRRTLQIAGDPDHPANLGRLCVKGAALGETTGLEGRLLHPSIDGARASWEDATTFIAGEFNRIRQQYGPQAIAFYVSGQLLTEDYYVVNKLAKGFIGTPNIDTNSRLCMSSAVAGHKRAFGADAVPCCYEDLEQAGLITLTGSNAAWCHPVLYQRIKAARERNPALKVVVIDPRETATCEIADLYLPVRPGMDVLLFNTLLVYLADHGALDAPFINQHTTGFADTLAQARADMHRYGANIAPVLGIEAAALQQWYQWFVETPEAMTLFSMGVNQSSQGADKVNAIINAHLASGKMGRPGTGPFSLTGQPNAMGGREVGGLANLLAAHMEIEQPVHRQLVQEFWQAPTIIDQAGLKAVDLFEAVESGQIKALWIMATNPVVSLPDADRVRQAIAQCPLVVVSEVMQDTDCTRLADVLLPACGWAEKDGTVTNSERCISRQRGVLPPAGQARPDWWALSQVARKMGFSGFDYQQPADIFREHAALSAYRNSTSDIFRDFNISAWQQLTPAEYERLTPFQWPSHPQQLSTPRLFEDLRFYTPDQRARFIAVQCENRGGMVSHAYPLILNTGRIRDQWHTMTRTGLTARLTRHISEPYADIHPDDAALYQIADRQFVCIESQWGKITVRANLTSRQARGSLFVPIHWNGINSHAARVGAVVNPVCDPVSGQPQSKYTPVRITALNLKYQGFLSATEKMPLLDSPLQTTSFYAVQVRHARGMRQMFASSQSLWHTLKARATALLTDRQTLMCYEDEALQDCRMAIFEGDRLEALFWHGYGDIAVDTAWLDSLTGQTVSAETRRILLGGKPADPGADCGPVICSCFGVGQNTIIEAIRSKGLQTVKQVGTCVRAGTNCGSCQSEIASILKTLAEPAGA